MPFPDLYRVFNLALRHTETAPAASAQGAAGAGAAGVGFHPARVLQGCTQTQVQQALDTEISYQTTLLAELLPWETIPSAQCSSPHNQQNIVMGTSVSVSGHLK